MPCRRDIEQRHPDLSIRPVAHSARLQIDAEDGLAVQHELELEITALKREACLPLWQRVISRKRVADVLAPSWAVVLLAHSGLLTECQSVAAKARGLGLPTGADVARDLAAWIPETWEKLDRPCSERAVEQALACERRRELAHENECAVLVHGDVLGLDALQAEAGFKLIDPIGLLAEPSTTSGP